MRCRAEVAESDLLRREYDARLAAQRDQLVVDTSALEAEHARAMRVVEAQMAEERSAGALAVTTQHRAQASQWQAEVRDLDYRYDYI